MNKIFLILFTVLNISYANTTSLENYFEKSNLTMILIDPTNGEIVKANNAASQFYGYQVNTLEKMTIQQINTFTKDEVKKEMLNAKKEKRNFFIFRHQLKDGNIKRVEVHSNPITYKNKALLFSIIHDISDNTALKKEIKNYNKTLEKQIDIKTNKLIENDKKLRILFIATIILQLLLIIYLLMTVSRKKKLQYALHLLNENLTKEVENKVKDIREKDKILYHQSKLAAMGEMLGNISHQWRQPLNTISALNNSIIYNYKKNKLNDETVNDFKEKTSLIIEKMDETIDDFMNYYRPDKRYEDIQINELINESLKFVKDSFAHHKIEIEFNNKEEYQVKGYKNELIQVLLNVYNNSKDAIKESAIKNGKVAIDIEESKEDIIIKIKDNAGGIKEGIINKVFEPYFTTKFKSDGTGIGLYMSKMIIEDSMNGKINLENFKDGCLASISLPKDTSHVIK